MKFVYSLIAAGIVLTGYFTYKPEQFDLSKKVVASTYDNLFFRKNVSVKGLRVLRVDAIRKLLPVEYSNIWWSLNTSIISGLLEKNPFIQTARVDHCDGSLLQFSCFIITVEERTPAYVALMGEDAAVLGEDGATIQSARGQEIEKILQNLIDPGSKPPVVLVGLVSPGASSDVTEARFRYLHNSIETIEHDLRMPVQRMELLSTGELSARIEDLPYDVVFDDTSRDAERLKDEVARLKKLIPELESKKDRVAKVDLSYNKIAVVSYR